MAVLVIGGNYSPELQSDEKGTYNSIYNALIVGLSGLAMEATTSPEWANKLTEDEAKLACRYAIRELNGFPDWFHLLWFEHSKAVKDVLLKEIEWELATYNGEQPCHYVLSSISWQLDWLKSYISADIINLLIKHDPVHDDSLEQALKIILSSPTLNLSEFSNLAENKLQTKLSNSRAALWLVAWMFVDADKAIDKLKTVLSTIKNPEDATMFAMLFISDLIGRRGHDIKSNYHDYNRINILSTIIKLVFQYIKVSDDINRTGGGVYSPGLRDDAQSARNELLQKLFDIPGKATYLVLLELSDTMPDQSLKQWCSQLAQRRAVQDAELSSWQLEDILSFSNMAECQPRTHRELFNLTCSRLNDLKAELEDSDSSIASILRQTKKETDHRKYIGQWLHEHSQGKYSVPQEEELADATRPDIRVHGYGFDAPVPIELKIADNKWTLPNLIERVNNQLCGQYLRDVRSNCGIFLIVYLGKKYWKGENKGEKFSFDELIEIIRSNADSIVNSHPKIESLDVISIDLTKRSKRTKNT